MSHLGTRLSALSLQSWYTRWTLRTGTKHEKQSLTTAWKQGGEGEYIYAPEDQVCLSDPLDLRGHAWQAEAEDQHCDQRTFKM